MTAIAITGATGQLGRLAIASLRARAPGHDIIALARDPGRAADLHVPARAFDYHSADPAALTGIGTLVLISSSDFDNRAGQHRNVVAAAQAAGVGRIVYTSILRADTSPMILAQDHKVTEAAIRASGLPATFLRNGWYTENYTGSLGGALAAGGMIGSLGNGRVATAARADYAEAIAVTASNPGHDGKVYELAGDDAYAMAEMAAEVSRQTGRTIPYTSLPKATYDQVLQGFGLPPALTLALADSDAWAAEGWLMDDSHTLSRLIGRPTTAMAETVRAALAAL